MAGRLREEWTANLSTEDTYSNEIQSLCCAKSEMMRCNTEFCLVLQFLIFLTILRRYVFLLLFDQYMLFSSLFLLTVLLLSFCIALHSHRTAST